MYYLLFPDWDFSLRVTKVLHRYRRGSNPFCILFYSFNCEFLQWQERHIDTLKRILLIFLRFRILCPTPGILTQYLSGILQSIWKNERQNLKGSHYCFLSYQFPFIYVTECYDVLCCTQLNNHLNLIIHFQLELMYCIANLGFHSFTVHLDFIMSLFI